MSPWLQAVLVALAIIVWSLLLIHVGYRRGLRNGKSRFDNKLASRLSELQGLCERSGLSVEALPPELRETYQGSWTGMSVRDAETRPVGVPARWDEVTRGTGR